MDDDTRYFDLSNSLKYAMDRHIDIEEESEDEDDLKPEYVCPFCLDDFDLVGFCCHIDDAHPIDAKSGICPICDKKVGINMAVHINTQHGSILKALYKKKLRIGGSHSTLCLSRKSSLDEHLERFVEDSSCDVSSSDIAADPLLSSFIYNPPPADEPESLQSSFTTVAKLAEKSSDKSVLERTIHPSPLSNKDQEENARRCEFVQGLLYSTILEDDL
ncbi:protein DEHYDRATION-INDUCED 19 homolog 4-like [Actinidia eriantha]|uniref:protein DEHYDRATION-INDUCED 19 homolog 4-like n=1 Tax=Actinidia eriantha TaxID=165200 RepID=UPI00258ABB07|nr:protein DEHYDRATION-INDUCED 19 homolog 4-like [Actinidia eriantha]